MLTKKQEIIQEIILTMYVTMERTTATRVPKDCCPCLSLDKVLRNEDIELLLL